MSHENLDRQILTLESALELFCGDVHDDEEWDPAFDEVAGQWAYFKEEGRWVRDAWKDILESHDQKIAQYLIENFANQGKYEPAEAYRILKKWYDHFQPVWESLETPELVEEISLPPYILDH